MQKKILVVDDDHAVRESLINALRSEGYSPLSAKGGDEAMELLSSAKPDLVLLDLNMPRKGGWEVFKEITASTPLLPVIVLTARPNQLFSSLGAGVGALIEKPFDLFKLLQTIRELLGESTEERLARLEGHPIKFQYLRPNGNTVEFHTAGRAVLEGSAN